MSALMAFVLRGLHSLEWRGAVASWLVCSSTERAVQVQALTIGDNVLCSWARQFTLTVPLSTQEYLIGTSELLGNPTNCGGVTCEGLASHAGGVEILLAASCYRNRINSCSYESVMAQRLHTHSLV